MHQYAGVVVEIEFGAGGDGECGLRLYHEAVVDMIWLVGRQLCVCGIAHVAAKPYGIASSGLDRHLGCHSVSQEFNMGEYVDRLIEVVFRQCGFHENEYRIVCTDFNVVELASADPVDIHSECAVGVVAECDLADVKPLAVAIIDDEAMGW